MFFANFVILSIKINVFYPLIIFARGLFCPRVIFARALFLPARYFCPRVIFVRALFLPARYFRPRVIPARALFFACVLFLLARGFLGGVQSSNVETTVVRYLLLSFKLG